MDKRVQRVGNAACLGSISHARSAIDSLYEGFANDYLTVTGLCQKIIFIYKNIKMLYSTFDIMLNRIVIARYIDKKI